MLIVVVVGSAVVLINPNFDHIGSLGYITSTIGLCLNENAVSASTGGVLINEPFVIKKDIRRTTGSIITSYDISILGNTNRFASPKCILYNQNLLLVLIKERFTFTHYFPSECKRKIINNHHLNQYLFTSQGWNRKRFIITNLSLQWQLYDRHAFAPTWSRIN